MEDSFVGVTSGLLTWVEGEISVWWRGYGGELDAFAPTHVFFLASTALLDPRPNRQKRSNTAQQLSINK